jgi:ligand-binding sensor domain-containing protein/two-component sensor histidine kinase
MVPLPVPPHHDPNTNLSWSLVQFLRAMAVRRWPLTLATGWCAAVAFVFSAAPVVAEQLPLRHYSVSDGLPHSTVKRIFQDSRGYLWIGTADGLARFDGYHFNTYDTSDGLGHTYVNSIAEDRQGRIWVGTNGGGVSCLEDGALGQLRTAAPSQTGPQRFVSFLLADLDACNRVNALLFDDADRLWCLTDGGLFRTDLPPGRVDSLRFDVIVPHHQVARSMGALRDSRGRLWFGLAETIVEVAGDQVITYKCSDSLYDSVNGIVEDHKGHLLASSDDGILTFTEPPAGQSKGAWQAAPADISGCGNAKCLMVDYEDSVWVGTQRALVRFKAGKRIVYGEANGLTDNNIEWLEQDRDRNIWIGTTSGGLFKLSGTAAIAFTRPDGLPGSAVELVFVDRPAQTIIASTRDDGLIEIVNGRVTPLEWSKKPPFATAGRRICHDPTGNWWIGTDAGVFFVSAQGLSTGQTRRLTAADGGVDGGTNDVYIDPGGRLWFGTVNYLLHCVDVAGFLKDGHARALTTCQLQGPANRIMSDRGGAVWVASPITLARVVDGKAINQAPTEGLPETAVRAFFLDSRGWFWLGLRNKGVSICKNTGADRLEFVNYSTANGLANNTVWAITEDDWGRIYLGTGKGLDRIDPATGRIQHITAGENLAGDLFDDCTNDGAGNIWLATTTSIIQLDTRGEPIETRAPPIYLTRLAVEGAEVPVADDGAHSVPSVVLGPSGNDLLIEYVGLDFHSEHELKYQYKLEGVDSDWGPLSDLRSVNYARLSPGSYTFMVRALNQEGLVSPEPAILRIRILPPIWRRWWFVLVTASAAMLIAYAVHRYRITRLMELLAVRTRIASDLHDDIGSNLTKIAILSEVANRQLDPSEQSPESPITAIARISRESVASMSDIVWAIDPRRDTHLDLTRRMRQFAIELLGSGGIDVRVESMGDDQAGIVGPDFRRQVFLVFKEAVHNAARHSHCSKVDIRIQMESRALVITVHDDGVGFDVNSHNDGQGLASMSRRAQSLGGKVDVVSGNNGTSVTLSVPWDGSSTTLRNLGTTIRRLIPAARYSGNGRPANKP